MPTVPVVDPSAAPDASAQEPAPSSLPPASSMPGATIGDRLAEQVDDARTKQAESAALAQSNNLLYGPNGYLTTSGEDAVNGLDAAKQAQVKAFQDQLQGLGNSTQQQMFTQTMNQHLLSIGTLMDQHHVAQTRQYAGQSALDRANTYATSAAMSHTSYGQRNADGDTTGEFAKNTALAEQEMLNAMHTLRGAPAGSATTDAALQQLHTGIATDMLTQMMNANASASRVQQVFDDLARRKWVDAAVDPRAAASLTKIVTDYGEQQGARNRAVQLLSDAQRAHLGLQTGSTGTPDYQFGIRGSVVTPQVYDPEQGGVTVCAPQGTSIQAPADGKVTQVGRDEEGNFAMQMQHGDGSTTTLTGLSSANVKTGDTVQRGEDVASSGSFAGGSASSNSGSANGGSDAGGAPAVLWSLHDKDGNAVDPTRAGLPAIDVSKITDEAVLQRALEASRQQIADPSQQQQAQHEMVLAVRGNQQRAQTAATQLFNQASDAFYAGGKQWSSIPAALFNQLTPQQQRHFKALHAEDVMDQFDQTQRFRQTGETGLVSNFLQSPATLTVDNVNAARPNLSNDTYQKLLQRAQGFAADPSSVAEAQGVQARLRFFAGQSGINVDPTSEPDQQTLIGLTNNVQQALEQIKSQNNGKATPEQVDKAIQQELIQHIVAQQHVPQVGDTRVFPNGKTGSWDGQGWLAQSGGEDAGAQPAPEDAASSENAGALEDSASSDAADDSDDLDTVDGDDDSQSGAGPYARYLVDPGEGQRRKMQHAPTQSNKAKKHTSSQSGSSPTPSAKLTQSQQQEQKAEVGYGETAGLLPAQASNVPSTTKNVYDSSTWDAASAQQLQEARQNIMDISDRNSKVKKATASRNPIEQQIWNANMDAAGKRNGSMSGKYFFIRQDGVGAQRPPKKAGYGQGAPIRSYGPFRNVGGGDVPRGSKTYVDIYDK